MQAKEAAEARIIGLLRATGSSPVSGESISVTLGMSRSAVWKHIERLRLLGYEISASPRRGYTLKTPAGALFNEVEISAALKTSFIGKEIHFYQSLDSTNAKALELGRGDATDGAVVIADGQTFGKGRIGRRWESPPGVNLYTSIILRPPILPREAHQLTFVAAIAVAECVAALSPRPPTVKWPNDVLIDARKVAGILLEMASESDRVNFVVIGLGINVNMRGKGVPVAIKDIATSLAIARGAAIDRTALACALYSGMEKWYKIYLSRGFGPVLEAWKGFFASEGKPVKVKSFNQTTCGICMGVDADGGLLVRTPDNKVERVVSGDVETRG